MTTMMRRSSLSGAALLRQLTQRSAHSVATAKPSRFQQIEWRRAWTAEDQAAQSKHASLMQALQKAQEKDAALMSMVCDDLLSSLGSNWKLEITATQYEHTPSRESKPYRPSEKKSANGQLSFF